MSTVAPPPSPQKLKRTSKGPKPQYFQDPATDQLFSMVLALTQELSVVRDRADTLERLLDRAGVLSFDVVDAYLPTRDEAALRGERRAAMLKRVFRATEQKLAEINDTDTATDTPPEDPAHLLS